MIVWLICAPMMAVEAVILWRLVDRYAQQIKAWMRGIEYRPSARGPSTDPSDSNVGQEASQDADGTDRTADVTNPRSEHK